MAFGGGNASIMALGMEVLQSANVIQSNYVITSFYRDLVPSFDTPRTWQTYDHHQWVHSSIKGSLHLQERIQAEWLGSACTMAAGLGSALTCQHIKY